MSTAQKEFVSTCYRKYGIVVRYFLGNDKIIVIKPYGKNFGLVKKIAEQLFSDVRICDNW